jgi:uncharacterized iron-regulated membrane protein
MLGSWMEDYFWWIVGLALITVALTIYIFWGRRFFERGYKKGTARNPARVRRENPPDPGT